MQCDDAMQLLTKGIIIGEPIHTSTKSVFYPLYQNQEYTQIVCQTPWLRLSAPPRYIKRNTQKVYFIDFLIRHVHAKQATNEQHKWILFLNKIQKLFQKWLQKQSNYTSYTWVDCLETIHPYTFSNDVSTSQDAHHVDTKWKINTSLSESLKYYDLHQHEMNIQKQFIQQKQLKTLRMIIHFNHLWLNHHSRTTGLSLQILQIQEQCVFAFDIFSFYTDGDQPHTKSVGVQTDALPIGESKRMQNLDTNTTDSTTIQKDTKCDHPIYGVYFKMLKKRVPKPAVQHKMRMNGLDPAVLDMDSLDSLATPSGVSCSDQLTLSLKDDHQLKKTEINAHEKKVSNGAGHGFSLSEIVNGLKSLRKTILPSTP